MQLPFPFLFHTLINMFYQLFILLLLCVTIWGANHFTHAAVLF